MNTIGEGCGKTAEAKNWFLKEIEDIKENQMEILELKLKQTNKNLNLKISVNEFNSRM